MDDDAGAQAPQLLWINWSAQVVSFHQEEGFEVVTFPSHDATPALDGLSAVKCWRRCGINNSHLIV